MKIKPYGPITEVERDAIRAKHFKGGNPDAVEANASGDRSYIKAPFSNETLEALSKSESAHTPGPWEITQNYKGGIPLSVKRAGHNCTIARVDWLPNGSGKPSEVCIANAKLIAAAPETAAERDRLREQVEKLNLDLIGARLERGEMRKRRDELLAACQKAEQDINWMLNNQKFLNGDVFNYLHEATANTQRSSNETIL